MAFFLKLIIIIITFLFIPFSCGNFTGFESIGEPDTGNIRKIKLYLSQDDMEKLYNSLSEDDYAHCVYKKGSGVIDAWIKIRGDVSRSYPKKSFTLRFENSEKERYALTASFKDPSYVRNMIAFDIYREFIPGIPETECIALFINDNYIGYYTKIKLYNENDLKKYYGNFQLFKCKFDNMGSDFPLHYLSEKEFPDDDNFSFLDQLISCAKYMNDDDWNDFVNRKFDIEKTALYIAVHNYLAVTDTTTKNFNVIYNGKYSFLPWDHEANMGRSYSGTETETTSYPFEGDNMLMRRLLQKGSPVREKYKEFINDPVFIAKMKNRAENKLSQYGKDIDRAVYYDSNKYYKYNDFINEISSPDGYIYKFLQQRESEIPILE